MQLPGRFKQSINIARHRYLAMAGAAILLAGAATNLDAQESQGPYKPGLVKGNLTLEPATFRTPDGSAVEGEIGHLVVPESRASDRPNLIELAFVRLKSTSAGPKAPLVYLEGGPGGSSTWMAERGWALEGWLPILDVCDVILLDQRSTGKSTPRLVYEAKLSEPLPDRFFDRDAAKTRFLNMVRNGAAYFRSAGTDLNAYNSVESAHDIDALRRALGYDKISLMGFSYGTHLAMATMKFHGAALDNVILVGVEPLDGTHKLPVNADIQMKKLSAIVADDPEIGREIPDLNALLDRVLQKLDRGDISVPVYDAGGGGLIDARVSGDGLLYLLRIDLGDASDLPVFPRLIYSIDQDDYSCLQWFIQKRWPRGNRVGLMGLLVDGASGASRERWTTIAAQSQQSRFGNVVNFFWPNIDEATGVRDLGDEYRAPLVSDVRTLLLSGSLDYNTPPHQAERVRWGLSNATHIVVENAGHEQIIPNRDVKQAMIRFLSGEDVRDVTVVAPKLRFVPLQGFDPERTHPSAAPTQTFRYMFMTAGQDAAIAQHRSFRREYPDFPTGAEMNRFGYTLLRAGMVDAAIAVFLLNAEDYPDDFNVWDSLAEGYRQEGDRKKAMENYQKSLDLNPDNDNARKMLAELETSE